LVAGECVQLEPPKFGSIEVSAYSVLGEQLSDVRIELRQSWTGTSLASLVKGAVANKVPYGTYTLRVWSPGFQSEQREVRLFQPGLQVRVQLSVSVECGSFNEITGSIRWMKSNSELWVKLVPVRVMGGAEHVSRETDISWLRFRRRAVFPIRAEGTTIVHSQAVNAPDRRPVVIALEVE
jgi:hypothetical protein